MMERQGRDGGWQVEYNLSVTCSEAEDVHALIGCRELWVKGRPKLPHDVYHLALSPDRQCQDKPVHSRRQILPLLCLGVLFSLSLSFSL